MIEKTKKQNGLDGMKSACHNRQSAEIRSVRLSARRLDHDSILSFFLNTPGQASSWGP